mgnify:CR=1 FL=1
MTYKEFKKDIIEDIQITNNNIKKSENEILDESTEKGYKTSIPFFISKQKKKKKFLIYSHNLNYEKAIKYSNILADLELNEMERMQERISIGKDVHLYIENSKYSNENAYLKVCDLSKISYETRKEIIRCVEYFIHKVK